MTHYTAPPMIFPGTFEGGPIGTGLIPDMNTTGFEPANDWGIRANSQLSWQSLVERRAPLLDIKTGERDEAGLRELFTALGLAVANQHGRYLETDPREFAEAIRPPMPSELVDVAIQAYEAVFREEGVTA